MTQIDNREQISRNNAELPRIAEGRAREVRRLQLGLHVVTDHLRSETDTAASSQVQNEVAAADRSIVQLHEYSPAQADQASSPDNPRDATLAPIIQLKGYAPADPAQQLDQTQIRDEVNSAYLKEENAA